MKKNLLLLMLGAISVTSCNLRPHKQSSQFNSPEIPIQAEEAEQTDEMIEYQNPINRQEMEAQEASPEEKEKILEKIQKEELAE